jgi:hypothetical protein
LIAVNRDRIEQEIVQYVHVFPKVKFY